MCGCKRKYERHFPREVALQDAMSAAREKKTKKKNNKQTKNKP